MRTSVLFFLFLLSAVISPLFSQPRVDPRNRYERVLAVVPLIGAGTLEDPRRPLFAPGRAGDSGIAGFTWQASEDGRFALVEFVARERRALAPILNHGRADVRVFERGKARREDIEAEFRRHKASFDFSRFGVVVP